MAGRRLLDAAKLMNVAASIAKQNFAIQSQHFEVYNKTSTLAKAIKSQTDRVTLTAQAAVALAQRLNDAESPPGSSTVSPTYQASFASPLTGKSNVGGSQDRGAAQKDVIDQDGSLDIIDGPLNERKKNAYSEFSSNKELEVLQDTPETAPLPDGTIIPDGAKFDVKYTQSGTRVERPSPKNEAKRPEFSNPLDEAYTKQSVILDSDKTQYAPADKKPQIQSRYHDSVDSTVKDKQYREHFDQLSKEPTPKVETAPWKARPSEPTRMEQSQSLGHLDNADINADVISSPEAGGQSSNVLEQDAQDQNTTAPAGVDMNVFRSAKVAKMLSNGPQLPKDSSRSEGSRKQGIKAELASGHPDLKSTKARSPTEDTSEEALRQLGADLANENADGMTNTDVRR